MHTLKALVKSKIDSWGRLGRFINISFYNEDFPKLFSAKKDILRNGNNLLFLDQNGIKQIAKNIIYELETFKRTDYLFFISSGFFNRFSFKEHFPDLRVDVENMKQNDIHREILKYYREMLPADSKTKLYPFSLKKKRNIHGLIFGSKSLLGVEKFLDIAWQENPTNGEANFDIDNENDKQMCLFDTDKKIKKLEKFKLDFHGFAHHKKDFTNKDVLEYRGWS